jgi:hypothetical protein
MQLDKIQAKIKSGNERLIYNNTPLDFSILDFWRWSVSDILSNATRGRFAEFIVATATKIDMLSIRDEWSAYDLDTPEGIKLEIKSAAYIQSWFQKALSTITFSTKPAQYWDSITNILSAEKKRHANVYVFCLLHHTNKLTIDPLNMNQWEFYVLATKELNNYTRSQSAITLNSLKRLTTAVGYDRLYETIKEKHKLNDVISIST